MKTLITGNNLGSMGMIQKQKPRPKMACQVHSKVKVILTVVFNHKGVVHHVYTPDGQTGNEQYYVKVLCQLHNAVGHK
jgi:hypothetical protein